jgi:hypothetical protein
MTSMDEGESGADGSELGGFGGGGTDPDEPLDRLETGLNALFAAEVVEEIYEAVDVEALRAEEATGDAIDHERLARAVGDPVGRIVARRVVSQVTSGGVTGVVGRELAGRIGTAVVRTALEHTDPERALERVTDLDQAGGGPSPDVEPGEGTRVPFEDETGDGDAPDGQRS